MNGRIGTPKAVHKVTVCSVCGLNWADHETIASRSDDGTLSEAFSTLESCVRLLKAELAKKSAVTYASSLHAGAGGK